MKHKRLTHSARTTRRWTRIQSQYWRAQSECASELIHQARSRSRKKFHRKTQAGSQHQFTDFHERPTAFTKNRQRSMMAKLGFVLKRMSVGGKIERTEYPMLHDAGKNTEELDGNNKGKLGGKTTQAEKHGGNMVKKYGMSVSMTPTTAKFDLHKIAETLDTTRWASPKRMMARNRGGSSQGQKIVIWERCWQREVGGNRRWRERVSVGRTSWQCVSLETKSWWSDVEVQWRRWRYLWGKEAAPIQRQCTWKGECRKTRQHQNNTMTMVDEDSCSDVQWQQQWHLRGNLLTWQLEAWRNTETRRTAVYLESARPSSWRISRQPAKVQKRRAALQRRCRDTMEASIHRWLVENRSDWFRRQQEQRMQNEGEATPTRKNIRGGHEKNYILVFGRARCCDSSSTRRETGWCSWSKSKEEFKKARLQWRVGSHQLSVKLRTESDWGSSLDLFTIWRRKHNFEKVYFKVFYGVVGEEL